MENLDFVSVPIIVGTVFVCLQLLKKLVGNNEKMLKFLPIIAGGLGSLLGLIAFFALPEIIPTGNATLALLIGASSGFAATGTHQVYKQLIKKPENIINLFKKIDTINSVEKKEGKDDGTTKSE